MTAPARPTTVTPGDLIEGTPTTDFTATAHYDEAAGGLIVTSDVAVHIPMVPPRCRKPRWQEFHTTATVVIPVDPGDHRDVIQWEDQKEDAYGGHRQQIQVVVDAASQKLYYTGRNLSQPAERSALLKADWDTDEPTHTIWPEVWEHMPGGSRGIRVYFPDRLDNGAPNPVALGADPYWSHRSYVTIFDDSDVIDWPRYQGSVDGRTTDMYYFKDTAFPSVLLREHLQRVVDGQRFLNGDHFVACYEPNIHYSYGTSQIRAVTILPRPTQASSEPRWDGRPISVADPHVIDFLDRNAKITVTPGEAVGVLTNPSVEEVYTDLHGRLAAIAGTLHEAINDPAGDSGESYAVRLTHYSWENNTRYTLRSMTETAGRMRRMETDFPGLTPVTDL